MSRKFETIEELDAFADRLRKTREILKKAVKMMEAPTNELIKFNNHGQWELTKNKSLDYQGKGNRKKFDDDKEGVSQDIHLAEKGEGINGPETGAGSSL